MFAKFSVVRCVLDVRSVEFWSLCLGSDFWSFLLLFAVAAGIGLIDWLSFYEVVEVGSCWSWHKRAVLVSVSAVRAISPIVLGGLFVTTL